jgi:hypothetical protein
MCVMPEAPKRLLGGMAMLPKTENQLKLLPEWLASLRKIKMVRGIEGFAVQFWFYSQLYALGRTGRIKPDMTVFAAMREVEAYQKQWLRDRKTALS